MAHWIIEDDGFGVQNYKCSSCKSIWSDAFYGVSSVDKCPECREQINKNENKYIDNLKNKKETLTFPHTIGNITYYSVEELIQWVENQQKMNSIK